MNDLFDNIEYDEVPNLDDLILSHSFTETNTSDQLHLLLNNTNCFFNKEIDKFDILEGIEGFQERSEDMGDIATTTLFSTTDDEFDDGYISQAMLVALVQEICEDECEKLTNEKMQLTQVNKWCESEYETLERFELYQTPFPCRRQLNNDQLENDMFKSSPVSFFMNETNHELVDPQHESYENIQVGVLQQAHWIRSVDQCSETGSEDSELVEIDRQWKLQQAANAQLDGDVDNESTYWFNFTGDDNNKHSAYTEREFNDLCVAENKMMQLFEQAQLELNYNENQKSEGDLDDAQSGTYEKIQVDVMQQAHWIRNVDQCSETGSEASELVEIDRQWSLQQAANAQLDGDVDNESTYRFNFTGDDNNKHSAYTEREFNDLCVAENKMTQLFEQAQLDLNYNDNHKSEVKMSKIDIQHEVEEAKRYWSRVSCW